MVVFDGKHHLLGEVGWEEEHQAYQAPSWVYDDYLQNPTPLVIIREMN